MHVVRTSSLRLRLSMLAATLAVAAVGCSSTPTAPSTTPSGTNGATAVSSALEGEWDTGPYPAGQARDAIVAAGYTKADTYEVLGNKKRFEFSLTFYEENGVPFVVATGWDPSKGPKPSEGDHGPYSLLPNGRLKITCDVCDINTKYTLFSYEIRADTLTLEFIRSVDPDASAYDRRFGTAYGVSFTAAPFHKVAE